MPRQKKEKPVLDLTIYTRSGKLRKRKPKQSRNYFTQDTENAIIKYVNSEDQEERNFLFNEYINNSIHKLAENIIHTFKFYYTEVDNIEDLKHEVVIFLLERLPLYKQDRGRAYSYFGTIAKRYLITYNAANYKKRVDRKELDTVDDDKNILLQNKTETASQELSHFINSYVKYVDKNKAKYFHNDKEIEVVSSVLSLFRKREDLSDLKILNKQIVYLQIREMTGQSTQFVTKVIKQMKNIMKQQMKVYYLVGGLEIEEDDIYI